MFIFLKFFLKPTSQAEIPLVVSKKNDLLWHSQQPCLGQDRLLASEEVWACWKPRFSPIWPTDGTGETFSKETHVTYAMAAWNNNNRWHQSLLTRSFMPSQLLPDYISILYSLCTCTKLQLFTHTHKGGKQKRRTKESNGVFCTQLWSYVQNKTLISLSFHCKAHCDS